MKKILFLFFLFSLMSFSCKMLVNSGKPYEIVNNKVYYRGAGNMNMELTGAEPADFRTISYSRESCEYRDYGKDKKNVYFKNVKVEGADAESFVMLKQGYYKDKRYLYFYGKRLKDSDSEKEIKFIEDNKDPDCIPWGDGGCVINNGNKYKDGIKYLKGIQGKYE